MEEQKKEEIEVMDSGADETQDAADMQAAEDDGSDSQQEAPAGMPTRSLMLWVLAGIYLIYTGYRLCKNVIDGVEGASIGFMLSGIVFLVIGGALLFFGVRGVYRADRLKKAQEAAAQAKSSSDGSESSGNSLQPESEAKVQEAKADKQGKDGAAKRMSISERARLAERLEEEDADVDEVDIEETDSEEKDLEEKGPKE